MTLALAARYLRTLADIEQASAVGDAEFVCSLLDGIDPVDLRALVAEFEQAALAERDQLSAATDGEHASALRERCADRRSRSASAAIDQDIERLAAASQTREEALYKIGGAPSALDAPPHRATTEELPQSPPVAPVFACDIDEDELWRELT